MAKHITESQLRSAVKSLRQYIGEQTASSMPQNGTRFEFEWTNLNDPADPSVNFDKLNDEGAILLFDEGKWFAQWPDGTTSEVKRPSNISRIQQIYDDGGMTPVVQGSEQGGNEGEAEAQAAQQEKEREEEKARMPPYQHHGGEQGGNEGEAEAQAAQNAPPTPADSLGGRSFADASRDALKNEPLGSRSFADASKEANAARDLQRIKDLGASTPPGFVTGAKPGQAPTTPAPSTAGTASKPAAGGWQALYQANKDVIGSNPNMIKVGQQLKMPDGSTYTVKSGDTLSKIAGGGAPAASTTAAKPTPRPSVQPNKEPATDDFKGAAGELDSDPLNKERAQGWQEVPESRVLYQEDQTLARIIQLARGR